MNNKPLRPYQAQLKLIPLVLMLVAIAYTSNGQQIQIVKRDGTRITSKIMALSKDQIFTHDGTVRHSEIDTAYFLERKAEDNSLYEALTHANAKVIFKQYDVNATKKTSTEDKFKNEVLTTTPSDLETRLEKFRKQRTTGKALELIGFAAGAAASIIGSSAKPEDTNKVKALWIAGGAIATIGFVIDLDAGSRLKKK